jgi:ribosome biogenesis GTPase A
VYNNEKYTGGVDLNIQWYPGHMTKTRRMIESNLKLIDVVAEVIDARIPISSRNPDIDDLVGEKPRVVVLNRADQADPEENKRWAEYFRSCGFFVMESDAKSGTGVNQFTVTVQHALKEKIAKWREKGQIGRPIRAMVVGVPNVGKSTFINKIAKRKSAKTQDRPGVTRGKQWVTVSQGLELLDTPGILWPKFEDEKTGLYLAFTGAVRDAIIDTETLACHLLELIRERNPGALVERYKISLSKEMTGWEILEAAGKKRGFLISGGEVDLDCMASILLDEFRGGKLGRVTLELPEDLERKAEPNEDARSMGD